MKAELFDSNGEKKSEIKLPAVFDTPVREDIVVKAVELARFASAQPHALYEEAGRRHSASGTISHKRHEWKGHYGKGLARIPRKTMHRHGTQFYWVGAEVANTRGGRRVHGPTLWKRYRKINEKEAKLALASAIAATANESQIVKRYSSLQKAPSSLVVFESLPNKTAALMNAIKNAYNNLAIIESRKAVRAGKGKNRGRPHKENAGVLLVVGKEEKVKTKHVDIVKVNELSVVDLYPLGRLTAYTQKALEELKNA
jgi:large subunit ribosomal protein L4e